MKTVPNAAEISEGTEQIGFKKYFTPEEIAGKKDFIVKNLTELSELDNQLSSVKSQYKAKIENLESANVTNVRHVNDGFEHVKKYCYIVRDDVNQVIQYVDPDDGEVVAERPMKQEEKQLRMKIG